MSEDDQDRKEVISTIDVEGRNLPTDRDWLLADLAHFTNNGLSFDIIVIVGGKTIAGRTMSSTEYFEEMARQVEAGLGTATVEDRGTIGSLAEYYRGFKTPAVRSEGASDEYAPPPPVFIHLRNARIIGERYDVPATGDLLWRGRLSDVSGFALGSIERS